MNPGHYEAAMERDLNELKKQLRHMGALVVEALNSSAQALQNRDRRLAWRVVLADNRIDALEGRIDRMCQEFLVRHMPAGTPLRFIVAAIKVNSELERIGDYADAIAHRVVSLHGRPDVPLIDKLKPMFEGAVKVVELAVQAFVDGDTSQADAAVAMEGDVDSLNRIFFNELAHPAQGEDDLTVRFAVLGILNRLERVADRAVNIAEDGIWAAKGEVWRHHPRSQQKVLFISPADATLGPMAEAIARAHAPLSFGFASAGLEPAPLNPRMVLFMQQKGIEVVRPRSRGMADVGLLDDYSVVVTLSQEVEDNCPPLPYRTVQLSWDVTDPSQVIGDDKTIEKAFQDAFDALDKKIADLIGAMIGADVQGDKS